MITISRSINIAVVYSVSNTFDSPSVHRLHVHVFCPCSMGDNESAFFQLASCRLPDCAGLGFESFGENVGGHYWLVGNFSIQLPCLVRYCRFGLLERTSGFVIRGICFDCWKKTRGLNVLVFSHLRSQVAQWLTNKCHAHPGRKQLGDFSVVAILFANLTSKAQFLIVKLLDRLIIWNSKK